MAFYLDSAITAEAEIVKHWGWVTPHIISAS